MGDNKDKMNDVVERKVKELPDSPGVYIMRDIEGTVIYVGKARNLKNRVRSYFNSSVKTEKTYALVDKIADFDYIISNSEVDALVLENTLIKKYKPHYNILLKDDKLYPFLRIDLKEKYPTVSVIRRLKSDGARYFGPYMLGISAKQMIDLLQAAFPIRRCGKPLSNFPKNHRPCLYHQLGKCMAPCTGEVSEKEYKEMIQKVIAFLQGDYREIEELLTQKMLSASELLDFESALEYKNRLQLLDKMTRSQVVALPKDYNLDVFGVAFGGISSAVAIISVRGGKVVAAEKFYLPQAMDKEDGVFQFIYQYYQTRPMIADEIVCSFEVDESLREGLKSFGKAKIITPKSGVKKQLAIMADGNADEYLSRSNELTTRREKMTVGAEAQLAEVLGLKGINRIECYDISNISGTDKVSSMVVFEGGEKAGDQYRRFKIKTVKGANDFACMKETLSRRFLRYEEGKDDSFSKMPSLLVIDGGIGQVEYAISALEELGYKVPIIGLAKREETIVLPDGREISLEKSSFALRLLQRIRDEAHRFAITYHRSLRHKRTLESKLLEIKGVGKESVKKLYSHFKSFDDIKNASEEELSKAVGKSLAKKIYDYFRS